MSDYHIGRLIRGFRESKNISRKALYYGLKDVRLVSKMENGEQEMSKLLVDVLLERMGLSTDMYGYVFTIKEYERFQTRADILEALEKGDYIEAESLCKEYETMMGKRDKLEKQIVCTIHLLIAMEKGAEPEYLLEEAKEILFLTVPKFNIRNINDYMLSGIERMLIAVQAEMYCRMGNQELGMDVYYYSLLFHLERYCTDPWEQERQIPPLVMLMVRWLCRWERYSEMWICEKAIKVLRNGMRLTLLEPLMEYEMKAWETGCVPVPEGESEKEWKAGLEALAEVRKEYNVPRRHTEENMDTSLFGLMIRQNYRGQILGDVVRRIRMEKGMTVEKLAEGICEPENLRKIELGTMKPRGKTYTKLMKRLGQNEYEYHPVICSDDYRMYECYLEIKKYMYRVEYEKAEHELRRLEKNLDVHYKVNRQMLLKFRGIIKEQLNEINLEERLVLLQKALQETIPSKIELGNWPLNIEEVTIWNNIASTLGKMGEREDAIRILRVLKKVYEEKDMRIDSYKETYVMVLCNLSTFLGKNHEFEEGIQIVKKTIPLAVKWGQGNYLNILLYNLAWNTERLLEQMDYDKRAIEKTCLPLYKQNFSIANITQYKFYLEHIKRRCKECYKIDLVY